MSAKEALIWDVNKGMSVAQEAEVHGVIFTSDVLIGANIGLLPIDESVWSIYFGAVRIGYLDGLAQRVQNRLPERLAP